MKQLRELVGRRTSCICFGSWAARPACPACPGQRSCSQQIVVLHFNPGYKGQCADNIKQSAKSLQIETSSRRLARKFCQIKICKPTVMANEMCIKAVGKRNEE